MYAAAHNSITKPLGIFMNSARNLMRATAMAIACSGYAFGAPAAPPPTAPEWYGAADKPFGTEFPEWTGRLWEYVFSIPSGDNPFIDAGSNKCSVGQNGPVFFLLGNFGGKSTRNCDIPSEKAILFPVFNYFGIDTPHTCGQKKPIAEKVYRDAATKAVDQVTMLKVEIDGVVVPDLFGRRYISELFGINAPADNILNPLCGPDGLKRGVYTRAVDEGYYVMLKPLKPGAHVLRIQSFAPAPPPEDPKADPAPDFSLDVTYFLNVVAQPTR
jgi:hypothetical protein